MNSYKIKQAIPVQSEAVTVAPGADHVFTLRIHAIRANAYGCFWATLRGDSEPRLYTTYAGDVVLGEFSRVVFAPDGATVATSLTTAGDLLGLVFPTE